jgi:hypothetical protein
VIEYLRASQLVQQEQQQEHQEEQQGGSHTLAPSPSLDPTAAAGAAADPMAVAPSHARLMCFLSGPSDLGLGKTFGMPASRVAGGQELHQQQGQQPHQQQQGWQPHQQQQGRQPPTASVVAPGGLGGSAGEGEGEGSSAAAAVQQQQEQQQNGGQQVQVPAAAAAPAAAPQAGETLLFSSKSKLFYEQASVAAAAMGVCVDVFAGGRAAWLSAEVLGVTTVGSCHGGPAPGPAAIAATAAGPAARPLLLLAAGPAGADPPRARAPPPPLLQFPRPLLG